MNAVPAPHIIALGSSRALAAWIAGSGISAFCLALLYLPVAVTLGVACLLLVDGRSALQRHAWRNHRDAIVALKLGDGMLEYRLRSGAWHSGAVMPGALVTRWLTVARVQDDNGQPRRRVLLLSVDSLHADNYRRLRVHLRWHRHLN